jgi:hypothetical protein
MIAALDAFGERHASVRDDARSSRNGGHEEGDTIAHTRRTVAELRRAFARGFIHRISGRLTADMEFSPPAAT